MWEIAKKLKISYKAVYYSLHRTEQTGSNQNRKRSGCTTQQEDKYIWVSSLRNRRFTSPQLVASLNSTSKTPVSTSTVMKLLRDAVLLDRVAKIKPYLRLANKNKRFKMGNRTQPLDRWTLPRRPASRSRLFTVDVETGVLPVLFNEAASWGLRHLFLKLDSRMYLSSCSVVHRGLPLLFLFWFEPFCAVLWRE